MRAADDSSLAKRTAFAAGAPLLALRTLLGRDVDRGELVSDPHVPERVGSIELRGVVRGTRTDVASDGWRHDRLMGHLVYGLVLGITYDAWPLA